MSQMQKLNFKSIFEEPKEGDDVRITINSPMKESTVLHTYYTSRKLLEKSPVFTKWFQQLDLYEDYVEIGDNCYNGVSDLMLFNNMDSYYELVINCSRFCHTLALYDKYDNPNILRVLEYLNGTYAKYTGDYYFNNCLEFLQLE